MLLLRYIARVARPLFLAIVIPQLCFILAFPNLLPLLLISYIGFVVYTTVLLLWGLAHLLGAEPDNNQLKLTFVSVGVAILIASLFAIPHVLLFFNALPWALSATFLSITSTLIVFEERLARNRSLENRHDFSLIKIILSPTSSIARLRVLLEPNIHRARNQLELRRDVAAAENSLQVRTPGIEALTTRYMNVFARFPKEAIIDDAALYKKQFDRLREGQTFNEENEEQKRRLVDLRKDACRYALQEAQGLSAAYQETLSSAEQRRCYQNYREVALSLSLRILSSFAGRHT